MYKEKGHSRLCVCFPILAHSTHQGGRPSSWRRGPMVKLDGNGIETNGLNLSLATNKQANTHRNWETNERALRLLLKRRGISNFCARIWSGCCVQLASRRREKTAAAPFVWEGERVRVLAWPLSARRHRRTRPSRAAAAPSQQPAFCMLVNE